MKISLSVPVQQVLPQIKSLADTLVDYTRHLEQVANDAAYSYPESSLILPTDKSVLTDIQQVAKKLCGPKLKYIIDIGIGGSNLGTKAVYDAVFGATDHLQPDRFPKIFFADTNNSDYLVKLIGFLLKNVQSPEEILLVMISKSGTTTETVVNFEILYSALLNKFGDIAKRVVTITDEGSPLWQHSDKQAFVRLAIPKIVGGRYSVFSAVGLFPLLACGIDIEALREGARLMRTRCLVHDVEANPALLSACVLYHFAQQGHTIHNTFLFQPALESLGKWYRQLMGESTGKEQNVHGKQVFAGMTPIVSIGSTDLHSMVQLYLAGPKDKFTTFVSVERVTEDVVIPHELALPDLVENIAGVQISKVMAAILIGTKIAYEKASRPFLDVQIATIDAKSLGEVMQWKMMEMMYLAQLFQVNAFDQPTVESYKIETRQILRG